MVGAAGFEPATTRTPSVCATRLRHAPTQRSLDHTATSAGLRSGEAASLHLKRHVSIVARKTKYTIARCPLARANDFVGVTRDAPR
jgi:hypothetical protein